MSFIVGTVAAFIALRLSLMFLDQTFALYFDDVALTMVVGGTVAVGAISAPWQHREHFFKVLTGVLFGWQRSQKNQVFDALSFIRNPQSVKGKKARSIADELYLDGAELINLRFEGNDVDVILQERLHQLIAKRHQVADFFHNLAKYPPAFGLVGTVLGLVNLMRAISEGLDPAQTGTKMALALVATLYGLLVANFFIAPFAEACSKLIEKERFQGEIAVQAIVLAADGESLLKSQELLNSYISRKDRVNILAEVMQEGMSA